jgi:hypothetical protein
MPRIVMGAGAPLNTVLLGAQPDSLFVRLTCSTECQLLFGFI